LYEISGFHGGEGLDYNFLGCDALKMEVGSTSEILLMVSNTTRRQNTQNHNLNGFTVQWWAVVSCWGSKNGGQFLDHLSDCWLLKKDLAPWIYYTLM
jgi:hypothetical protein